MTEPVTRGSDPRAIWGVWAWVCHACQHYASAHRLKPGADLHDGPYLCPCGCQISQSSPLYTISRAEDRDSFRPNQEPPSPT